VKSSIILCILLVLGSTLIAADLYFVNIRNHDEAEALASAGASSILRMGNAYVVLADRSQAKAALTAIPGSELIAADIVREELAIDFGRDRPSKSEYPLIFSEKNLRLYRIPSEAARTAAMPMGLMPVPGRRLAIEYKAPSLYNTMIAPDTLGLDTLIDLVSQDSLESYLHRLEAFYRRLTGTDSCYAAADWIAGKFTELGYDSVVIDTFIGSQLWERVPVESRNVIATKVGSRFPDRIIVVGGHFDAVPDCPGADDNGSGTAGVMEIARVLKDIDTEMTFKFIAFDSEESWMWGSYDYADSVGALGEDIIYMQNLDMIGHLPNSDEADLYYGVESAYAQLWIDLAYPLVGILGHLSGYTASDHVPFLDNGYDATFVQERIFSSHYHEPSDSTTYISFDYMTRMVKASLATDYMVNVSLPPVKITGVYDVGDGQSMLLEWMPAAPGEADYFVIYYGVHPDIFSDSVTVPFDSAGYVISGLTEGIEYTFSVSPRTYDDRSAIALRTITGTPASLPALPWSLSARPLLDGIHLEWVGNNEELDFSHYRVIRDRVPLPDTITDFFYDDTDPALGNDFHSYLVVAVDTEGNISDTTGIEPVIARMATLEKGRILALNRTSNGGRAMINETVSGEIMRAALDGFNYDYFSDTSQASPDRAGLYDLIDYELVLVSAEGARMDEISEYPLYTDLETYYGLGGKLIIFSRRGSLTMTPNDFDTAGYQPGFGGNLYYYILQMSGLVKPLTFIDGATYTLQSDFIGAHSLLPGYPDLVWDSAANQDHMDISGFTAIGIPCPGFAVTWGTDIEIIYTYDSSTDSIFTEGKPVAWKKPGQFVYFEIPFSLMERSSAVTALRQAVTDLGLVTSADDEYSTTVPKRFELYQNYPNPFNPETVVEFVNPRSRAVHVSLEIFNILGQRIRILVDRPVEPGRHRIVWDGRDQSGRATATGIYLYRLRAGTDILTRKMILLK